MSFEFKSFNNIVGDYLRPWIDGNISESKFEQDLGELSKIHYIQQPLYEVVFIKSLSAKRDYYIRLIDNESIDYLNYFHKKMSISLNDDARSYLVDSALKKLLNSKLIKIQKEIQKNGYNSDHYTLGSSLFSSNTMKSDGSFIFDYLKHSFIRLYLEIQDSYENYYSGRKFTADDLYQKYFNHAEPKEQVIIEAPPIKVYSAQKPNPTKNEERVFHPYMKDFRNELKGVMDYDDIIKKPERFASFEEGLFLGEYIDQDYNFTDKRGKKNELAIIYIHLINKGYFSVKNFAKNKKITHADIRKFLDHRYNTNVDKQFRNFKNQPEAVANFIEKHFWLYNLPHC